MRIPRELYEQMIEHARAEAPNECVGTARLARTATPSSCYRAAQRRGEPTAVRDRRCASRSAIHNDIEDAGLELGAIYHSHTRTAPSPSQTDISFAAGWPGVLWVIVGLASQEPDVRTWRIEAGQVTEAELVVE